MGENINNDIFQGPLLELDVCLLEKKSQSLADSAAAAAITGSSGTMTQSSNR